MTGAFLNALGILLGGLFGLARHAPLSAPTQNFFRRALGAASVACGLRLVWLHLHGPAFACAKQAFLALLALTLGNGLGRLLRLQSLSNALGRHATGLISASAAGQRRPRGDGFNACTILFCAAPLGVLGAVTEGLGDDFGLLSVKAVMDALATASFMKIFGWPAALSAFPVYAVLGALTLASRLGARTLLAAPGLADPVMLTAGLTACVVALVIFEVRRVELANYLPGLALAPFLAWLLN